MIEQTTLHNILTWIIAVVLFIFQSLSYFIAWIKKYVKHGQKTVVTVDTTISSESILDNKNVQENVITVQGLIQKHFDIPLIIAEDDPKVYNFIKSAQILTSNEICKEKTKIDQFMENLVDDSYVARGLGLITATVGRQSEFYVYSKYDNNFENVVIKLNGRNGEIGQITILSKNPTKIVEPKSIPMDYIHDKDRIKVTYTPFAEGVYTLTLVRNNLSICRSPYYISVEKSPTNSRSQIRLGTKKYKPVTKFAKSKHSSETCDNSIPVIEPSKPSLCKNILQEAEKNSIRTDVMSIVTKFESNSMNSQERVHKSTSSISEKGSETNMFNEVPKYSNIPPRIETDNVHDTYVSDLNSPSIHSKTKSTDKNFWNDVDITYKNSKASEINTKDFETERIKKPKTKLNEHVGNTKDIPEVKNASSTCLQPTNSVLVESLEIKNLHDVEKHNQTFKTIELMDENKLIETLLDPTTKIYESEIKYIDNEPCIQNEVSCFDDEDRKTVVVMDGNEIESNPNDTVIQQITDSAQYNINTPFASVITKITNSICEKCSIQVLKIISEFPRDINITHKNNSNEMHSNFETLLAQPISININIDNMFEQPISATNKHGTEHLLNISPKKIKHIGTIDKDIKCSYLNEIEPIDSNSDKLCSNINNKSKELMIKQNKHNSKMDETIKDEISDHSIVPFAEHTIDKHNTVRKNNELSTNEIMKIKYSTTNEDNVLHYNQFNNNTIHISDNNMEIQRQHLQKSSEHSIDLINTNQFHENINKELNHISKEIVEPLDTSDLVTINYNKNKNCEQVTDEFKINNVIISDENTNIQSSVINNIELESKEVTLATTEYKSEDNEEQTNNISYTNEALTSIQNENQKLMIEKSIEPVLTSFKNKMVEKITQLYLNRDLLNADNTSTYETHDKHLTNNVHEIPINNNVNNTELNTKCIETLTSQLKNHIDKNEISEIILDQQKTDNNHLLKYVENILKTKINPSGLYAHTLGEIKLQTLVNTAMNHPNDQQIDNEFKNMIIDNNTKDDKLKKINNYEIVQDIEAMLVETPSVAIIKNTDELKLPKNEVTVTNQCKTQLINIFDTIEIENINTDSKQEMQTINVNENDTIVETNAVEIKTLQDLQKSHNTEIITPIIELRPTLETRIMNTSELVTVEENSSKEIQTTIEIIDSINIPEETDAVENIGDKNEYESVKLQFKENVIKIPHLVENETLNDVVENTSTNTSTKSNSTESVSMQAEIKPPGLTKVCSANDVTIERDFIYKLPPPAENIVIEKPNSQSIPTLNTQVSKNETKVTIGINTSDPQFLNTAITVLIPSKISLIENKSFIPKLRILSTLNKLDAIEILTIPKYSATCDTKITKKELQNTPESTVSPNKLYMKNIKLEKIENIDETRIPTDTEIETLDLNESGKIKSIPPISNDTLAETTVESKTEKYTLHKLLNPKYKVTTLGPTVNEINCNNTKNETTIPISSSAGEVVEKPIKKHTEIESTPPNYPQSEPDKKVDEMLICTEADTPTVIDTSKASLVRKIVVEFVTNKNKTPIETLEIIVDEQIEEDIVTVREITPTLNSLVAVIDEQVNINTDGSDTYYVRSDDNVTNTGTITRKSIGQNNAEKVIEDESPSPINSLGALVQENMNTNINTENETLLPIGSTVETIVEPTIEDITEPEITSCTESSTEIIDIQFHAGKIVDEVLIDSLGEVMGENTNRNIVSESEKLLPIVSTEESILEPTVEKDIPVTAITSCTDFSTLTVDVRTDVEKVIEEESMAPNNSLSEVVVLNIDTENETLLQIDKITESVEEKKEKDELIQTILPMKITMESIKVIEDITETEITSCTESSTKIIQYQDHAEKMFNQETPPVPINFLEEEVDGKSKVIIDTETETHLPIVSTIESIEKPKLVEGAKATKIPYCTESSTEITDTQMGPDNLILEPSPTPINLLSKIVVAKTKVNINTDSEAFLPAANMEEKEIIEEPTDIVLPIQSTIEFIQEPKLVEDIIEIKMKSCTDSSTVAIQKDIKNVIEEKSSAPINSLGEVEEKNKNDDIDKENEMLLSIDSITGSIEEKKEKDGQIDPLLTMKSTMESIKEPKEDEDITVTEITSCTNSSPVILEIQMDVEKVIEDVPPVLINSSSKIIGKKTPAPINSLVEELGGKLKVNIHSEDEKLLPIKLTTEFVEIPKAGEDTTEIKIVSGTDSCILTVDAQTDVEKELDEVTPVLFDSSGQIIGEKTKVNMDAEYETILPIEATIESIDEKNVVEDIIEIKMKSCTDSSTVAIQKDIKNVIEEESSAPINSLGEVVEKNKNDDIDKENEMLLSIDSITGSIEEKKEKDGQIDPLLTMKSTMESIKEPKEDEDITVTEITSCTNSSPVILEIQMDVEKVIEDVPPVLINSSSKIIGKKTPAPINSLVEELGGKLKVNIHSEDEKLLPIKLTTEFVEIPKAGEDTTEIKIVSGTDSCILTVDAQTDVEKELDEVTPVLFDSSGQIIGEKTKVNMDAEYETILPIEATIESIDEKNVVEDIIEIKMKSCTDSSTVAIQKDIKNVIEEESSAPINSLGEVVEKNKNDDIDKENEMLLPIDSITGSIEEKKEKDGQIDPLLTMKSTMESIKEPKEDEDITVTEITSCTNSSPVILEIQMDVEKVIEDVPPVLINSSSKIIGKKTKVNMDTEYETILLIESTIKSIEEPEINEDITRTKILTCTSPSNATVNVQIGVKKVIEEVSMAPFNCSVEEVGGESNVNIHTKNETLLPIELKMETIAIPKKVEDITDTEISPCSDSCILTVDAQTDKEKGLDEITPEPINSSGEIVAEKTNMDIYTEKGTILLIKKSISTVEDRKAIDGTTEIVLPIESTMEFKKEPKVVEDITINEITPCTDSSSVIEETKIDVEKVIDEVSVAPINCFDEEVGGKSKVNISTQNETVLPIKTSTISVEDRKAIEGTTKNILLIESTIEYEEESIVVEDINVTEKTPCTDSSSGIVETKTGLEKVIEEVPTLLINSSCKIIGEKTKVNIDTEYETILPIGSTIESAEEPNAVEDITETEITSCTDSSTENMMDVQSKIEKYKAEKSPVSINSLVEDVAEKSKVNFDTDNETFLPVVSTKQSINKVLNEVTLEPINSSGEVTVEKTNINIDTGNETILPIKTSTCSVEDKKAIEGTTGIVLPIEFTVKFKKEPKVVEDVPVTEITPCTDSCILTVYDQTDVEKKFDEVTPVLFDSSGQIIGEKTKMNIDTEYETILPIEASYESIEEPKVVEDITEIEITSCTESSTENMMDVQTNNEKYITKKSPAPINSLVEEVGGKLKVNIHSEYEKLLPIELAMEFVEIPKAGEDTTEIKIVSGTDSCILTVDDQTDVEKDLDEVTPVIFDSSGQIIGEKTKVNMDAEYETILPIEATIESIDENNVVEDVTESEIKLCTVISTEKCKVPINSLVDEVSGKSKANTDMEDETLLPIESTKQSIEETTIEPTVVTETEILSCTESSSIVMNYQNHTQKIVDKVPINYLSEVMGENINVNIVTENETHLPIGSTMEAVEKPNVVEDITEIEKRSSTESSSIILDNKIYLKKVIEEVPSVLIDSLDKVVGENPKVNMGTKYETILPIESTIETIPESETYEDMLSETEILSCTEHSTGHVVAQTKVEKFIGEVSLTLINSSDKVVRGEMNVNIDNENETLLPIDTSTGYVKDEKGIYKLIESTVKSIEAPKVEDITEPKFTSCTESLTEMIDKQNQTENPVLINSSDVVVGGNTDVNIVTVTETLLPIESTMVSIEVSKEVEDIKETEKIPSNDSITITVDIHTDVEQNIDKESPSLINSFGELVQENMNMNIDTENKTLLPIELAIESIEESNVVDDRTEIEITSYTKPLTKIINPHFHAEKITDKVKINPLGEVMGENTNMKMFTESETLLSIGSTEESMVEPKVEEDITVTTKTSCADSSTLTIDVQTDVEKVIEEESLLQMKSLGEVVQENTNVSINTKNETLLQIDTSTSSVEEIDELIETLLPIKSNIESINISKKVEDINETEKISFTDSSILTKDFQTDVDIVIEKKSPSQINFLVNILEENTKVNNDTENETILPIESTEEITLETKVEADINETAITLCTDSSTATVDVQTEVEKVIEEVSPVPIHSSGEVVGESTKLYIDTENETLLQIDTSITAVKAVLEEKIIVNEYSTPTFSAFLDVEKQINVIIDSKTETLFPRTNTTFVDEPNVVEHVSENEHAALIDSSITSIKQQMKVDTETEIETLLLIDNLTESIKEQIFEKITENKTPILIDSLAETVREGIKVNINTDNQTLLKINTSSTIVDDQIVKNGIKNETQTPIVNVTKEQTKVNIETNNKTITPIDIFTTSIEEQLNVEYLCENENTIHIDSVPTMIKNPTKIDIETENETLLSIENTSFKEQMDEVDKIMQNNLLVDFSAATELKGYEILTDTETETSTSINTLNTTVDKQTMKENFKQIESRLRIATSIAFEEEQKSVEHMTVKENVLSIGTSTASVEEEIQAEEFIKNESATLISYSTIPDMASLEEPKVIENDTTAKRSSVTVVEEQTKVVAAEEVIDTCKESLDKTMIEKGTRHNETPTPIDILVTVTEKQTDLKKVVENEIPILVNTSAKSVEKQIKTEKVTKKETITPIACEALPKIETNEFEAESENETSKPVNNSASITIKQTEAEDVTETTLQNDDIIYRNTKTNLIGTENSDNSNNCYLKFGESSKMHRLENEDNLQRKSYGIQKLEMSVQRMKSSDEDYYEKTFVQLEHTEKISKVDKVNVDGENKTIINDKLYTVNESDLNAILCASSLEEALTLLDSKIKFKFKHKKSSSKINSVECIPKIQTSDSSSSGVNTNFTDARKFFKEIEKKSKK